MLNTFGEEMKRGGPRPTLHCELSYTSTGNLPDVVHAQSTDDEACRITAAPASKGAAISSPLRSLTDGLRYCSIGSIRCAMQCVQQNGRDHFMWMRWSCCQIICIASGRCLRVTRTLRLAGHTSRVRSRGILHMTKLSPIRARRGANAVFGSDGSGSTQFAMRRITRVIATIFITTP